MRPPDGDGLSQWHEAYKLDYASARRDGIVSQ